MKDYYKILGIQKNAKQEEIKKAYRKMAMQHHPDRNPGDKASEDKFKNVQEAYDILSDDQKRQMYDKYGFYSEQGFPPPGGQGQPGGFGFGGFDFGDVFGQATGRNRDWYYRWGIQIM